MICGFLILFEQIWWKMKFGKTPKDHNNKGFLSGSRLTNFRGVRFDKNDSSLKCLYCNFQKSSCKIVVDVGVIMIHLDLLESNFLLNCLVDDFPLLNGQQQDAMVQKINAMMSKFELMVITEMRDKDYVRDLHMAAAKKVLQKKMLTNTDDENLEDGGETITTHSKSSKRKKDGNKKSKKWRGWNKKRLLQNIFLLAKQKCMYMIKIIKQIYFRLIMNASGFLFN